MRNCIFYSLVLALLFLIGSCKDSDDNKTTGATYDPNQPVTVESFMPVDGKRLSLKVLTLVQTNQR